MRTPSRDAVALLADSIMKVSGWRLGSAPPRLSRAVVIAAPHTTLADGFWMLVYAYYWGWRINWLVKKSVVDLPLVGSWLSEVTGAVPVDRSSPQGLVEQLVTAFEQRDHLLLAVAPEATRSLKTHWKSGFYRIAQEAGVPICLSYLDYEKKESGFGPCFHPSGDIVADMDRIRAFYSGIQGKYPAKFTPPRLREEET